MDITMNGKPVSIEGNRTDLDALIGEIMTKIPSGEIPSEVKINGSLLSPDIIEKYKSLGSVNSITLMTVSIQSMLTSSIDSSRDVLASLEKISTAAIEMFRLGREMEGNKLLEGMIYFLEYFVNNIDILSQLIKKTGKDPSAIFSENDKGKFLDILTELKDSQLNMDDIMIADLIEYEVMPTIKKVNGDMESFVKAL